MVGSIELHIFSILSVLETDLRQVRMLREPPDGATTRDCLHAGAGIICLVRAMTRCRKIRLLGSWMIAENGVSMGSSNCGS